MRAMCRAPLDFLGERYESYEVSGFHNIPDTSWFCLSYEAQREDDYYSIHELDSLSFNLQSCRSPLNNF
jgi:hypothetical protein